MSTGIQTAEATKKVIYDAGAAFMLAPETAMFAGWQAMPRPTDPRERAMHLIHVLREWRGSVHVACVAAEGVSALDAIMLNGGAGYAEFFGWPQPYGEGNGQDAAMTEAERATSAACGSVFDAALALEEQAELVALIDRAGELITAKG